jgi:hypothetical protein
MSWSTLRYITVTEFGMGSNNGTTRSQYTDYVPKIEAGTSQI